MSLLVSLPEQAQSGSRPQQFDARTAAWLRQATQQDTATFLVYVQDSGAQAQADQARSIADIAVRRETVDRALRERAASNEAALRAFLGKQGLLSSVRELQSFKSFSGFALTTDKATLEQIKGWERVTAIELAETVQLHKPLVAQPLAQVNAVEWNIAKIGADRVHAELGINGSGVVVGSLDSGVRHTHQALSANYKCAGTSHAACWRDSISGLPTPYDDSNHGTHTMGTAVGSGGIGVAPGAKWIACKALNSGGLASATDILECFDWFLAPGGSSANAPDIVINSWGSTNGSTTAFQQAVTNWVNAGIYPAFSNGNSGPSCGTVGAPASYTNAVGTGATDSNDVIASFSSRGASPFGVIKPDLVAPGVSIRSAVGTGDASYGVYNGTSMAAPHVAGLAALLLDANPALTIAQLTANMKANALPIAATACGSAGVPNNAYGWGRIRAYESVRALNGWSGYQALVGDVNGDGRDDLIWNYAGSINRTYVGLANANGTFTFLPAQDRAEPAWSGFQALVGDVNGDGRDDLIWNYTGNTNRTYVGLANANGTFTFLPAQDRSEPAWSLFRTFVGDVNGDGRDDLIWSYVGNLGNRTYVGLANANGTFTFLPAQDRAETGWDSYRSLVGDVNGDGRSDIIWNDARTYNRTYVGLANANGTFTFLPAQDRTETGWNSYLTLVGDVNGDGRTDLIWNDARTYNRTYVGLANTNGTFAFLPAQDRSETGWNGYRTLVGDVNGDGRDDLIWNRVSIAENRTYVGLSSASGAFTFLPAQDHP